MLKSYETPEALMLELNTKDVLTESETTPEDTTTAVQNGQYGVTDGGDL